MTKEQLLQPHLLLKEDGETMSIVVKPMTFIHNPMSSVVVETIYLPITQNTISDKMRNFFMYVQIIENDMMPNTVGKIIPFQIPKKAFKLIESKQSTGINCFDPIFGANIRINYRLVDQQNYERKFYDIDVVFEGNTNFTYEGVTYDNKEDKEQTTAIVKILKDNMSEDFLELQTELKSLERMAQDELKENTKKLEEDAEKWILKVMHNDRSTPISDHIKPLYINVFKEKFNHGK